MRRIGVSEERGSGVDKVVFQTEYYQLPVTVFEESDEHTRCVLFAHREFRDMDKQDRIRATYLHACLRYVQRDYMTNSTLRERSGPRGSDQYQWGRTVPCDCSLGLPAWISVDSVDMPPVSVPVKI